MKLSYIFKIKNVADTDTLAQIENPQDLTITKILNGFGTARFFLPFGSPFATKEIVNKFNRVDIFEQIGGEETKIFEGVIRGYEPNLEGVVVNIMDFLGFFQRRILFSSDYTVSSEPVNDTLTNILAIMNGLDDTKITIDTTDILTNSVDPDFKRGEDFSKIVRDLAVATEGEFQFLNRKLQFKSSIGTDRTIPGTPEFKDFRYDIVDPAGNSINRAEAPEDSNDYANAILGKADSSFSGQFDSPEIAIHGRIESSEYFSTGSAGLINQISKRLDIAKAQPQFPKIEPNTSGMFYQTVDVGDIIPIFINTGSELFSFDRNYKIVKKTLRRTDLAIPRIDLEFSENAVGDKNLVDNVNDLQEQVKALQITI